MIKEFESKMSVIKISSPKINFPEISLEAGESIGIYTNSPSKYIKYFFKIITDPSKNAEKVTINEIVANTTPWVGRTFTHIVIPEVWNDDILQILKNKPERRHLIFIGAKDNQIKKEKLPQISEQVHEYLKKCAILTITDSTELIEAVCKKVIDTNGNELILTEEKVCMDKDGNIVSLDDVDCNIKNINIKKYRFVGEKNDYLEDLF